MIAVLRQSTLLEFPFIQPQPQKVERKAKKGKKKPLHKIDVSYATEDSPAYKNGCRYLAGCSKIYGDNSGRGGPFKSKKEVIQMILHCMKDFKKYDDILGRDPDPVKEANTLIDDKTGEFTTGDFFTSLGSPWPPNREKRTKGQTPYYCQPCAQKETCNAEPMGEECRISGGKAVAETRCCDTCIGGYSNSEVITMDCPDYPDVSNGTIDQVQLRATTRRLGCTFWAAPGTPPKIPNWAWCVGTRSCKSLSSVDGVCTKTGQKLKEMTYCPTQHLAEKPPRKCCPTCRHHKTKKTFADTCPRLPDLMFKGGKMSANDLMLETSLKDCEHWQEKPAPVKKPRGKKLEKGSVEWLAELTESKRKNNPNWSFEVWATDADGRGWLFNGSETHEGAVWKKKNYEEAPGKSTGTVLSIQPRPGADVTIPECKQEEETPS